MATSSDVNITLSLCFRLDIPFAEAGEPEETTMCEDGDLDPAECMTEMVETAAPSER